LARDFRHRNTFGPISERPEIRAAVVSVVSGVLLLHCGNLGFACPVPTFEMPDYAGNPGKPGRGDAVFTGA
jgi:hypothetical protein